MYRPPRARSSGCFEAAGAGTSQARGLHERQLSLVVNARNGIAFLPRERRRRRGDNGLHAGARAGEGCGILEVTLDELDPERLERGTLAAICRRPDQTSDWLHRFTESLTDLEPQQTGRANNESLHDRPPVARMPPDSTSAAVTVTVTSRAQPDSGQKALAAQLRSKRQERQPRIEKNPKTLAAFDCLSLPESQSGCP